MEFLMDTLEGRSLDYSAHRLVFSISSGLLKMLYSKCKGKAYVRLKSLHLEIVAYDSIKRGWGIAGSFENLYNLDTIMPPLQCGENSQDESSRICKSFSHSSL